LFFTRAGAGLVSKIAPKLSPIKSRFAVGSADAFTAGYTQSELMVANKGFMSEQEKDNQVAVSSLFTAECRLYFLFLYLVVRI
jgi:hypothetical protein